MLKKIVLFAVVLCTIVHGTLCAGKQGDGPPSPPPPPPPPPAVNPPSVTLPIPQPSPHNVPPPPLTPAPLLPNQCSFGAANLDSVDSSEGFAEQNTLYVLANDPAECSGVVDSLELCYYITSAVETSFSVQFLAFRRNSAGDTYRKLGIASVNVGADFANGESGDATCESVDLASTLRLSEGDVLGFVTEDGLSIAFTASEGRNVFKYVPSSESRRREKRLSVQEVSELQSLSTTQLKQANNTATPVLKIIMNGTNTSSQITPTPTTTPTAKLDGCSGDKSSRERTISFFTFTAAMVASAVMIAALFVAVFVLLCCLCGCCACCGGCCKCKICKVFKVCCGRRCPCSCQREGQSAQKVTGIHDQSMQYNELYMPTDQETVISRGKKQLTKLHENPAYGQHTVSQSSRGFDHTYESVEVARSRHGL